jgi:hypothetical protein
MMVKHCALWMALVVSGVACVGCNADDAAADAGKPNKSDAGINVDPNPPDDCGGKPGLVFGETIGTRAMGEQGVVNARLVDADVKTPRVRVPAKYTVDFTDAKGGPIDDLEVVMVCARMPPPHNHFKKVMGVSALAEPGRFEIEGITFTMAGTWNLQFALTSPSAPAANATAPGCGTDANPAPSGNEYLEFAICVPDI